MTYMIRIREEHASLTCGWPKTRIAQQLIKAGEDHASAVALYHAIRAATYRQHVTLYAPSGRRVKEALGTATEPK